MSSDPRFSRLRSDPRFRRPKKPKSKLVVDERFKSVFDDEKKSKNKSAGRVDKYGRPLADSHDKDNLRRFYNLDKEDAEAEDDSEAKPTPLDYARGQVLLESSDEEEDPSKDLNDDDDDDESDADGFVTVGGNGEDSEAEIDLDESETAVLTAQAAEYSKQHPEIDDSDRTRRLAVVNLDWDHVRASHLYKICASLASPSASAAASSSRPAASTSSRKPTTTQIRGQILSVRVFPSEFGKERMAREEKEGPPAELFKKTSGSKEINEKTIYEVGNEDDVNEDALRKYQLDRMRYYYAIIECDSVDTASHIYDELEGTELERSANVFDLSFVPDGMDFDDTCRDEATEDAGNQSKSLDFVTDALRHSKVKLTWDEDDAERTQITRRTFTKKDLEENNFKAYIASSSDESDDEERPKKPQRKAQKDKLRALLLGGNDDLPEGWARDEDGEGGHSDVDMEVTFTPGLTDTRGDHDETTLEKYQRKMKEKRKQRTDERKKAPVNEGEEEEADDFFGVSSDEELEQVTEQPKSAKKVGKEKVKEDLSHLVDEDDEKHFDMKAVLKAEKKSKFKSKKSKRKDADAVDETQPDFALDVADSRFSVLHEDASFAIDPSNPQFKRTKGMAALLEEGGKRRQKKRGIDGTESTAYKTGPQAERKLESLVDSVKRKSLAPGQKGNGKRQKLA